jgi:hypothetical protein
MLVHRHACPNNAPDNDNTVQHSHHLGPSPFPSSIHRPAGLAALLQLLLTVGCSTVSCNDTSLDTSSPPEPARTDTLEATPVRGGEATACSGVKEG